MGKLLDSHAHSCFHSPVCNVHQHPNLHHCLEQNCPGAISEEMAQQAGFVDDDGNVKCPVCNCDTYPSGERKVVEVHAKLCTDETIHYPEMHKAGNLDTATFEAWKGTLSREELMGYYKRTPDVHVTAVFHHDDAELMTSNLDAFNQLLNQRLRERAEVALLHQAPHRHVTTRHNLDLK